MKYSRIVKLNKQKFIHNIKKLIIQELVISLVGKSGLMSGSCGTLKNTAKFVITHFLDCHYTL